MESNAWISVKDGLPNKEQIVLVYGGVDYGLGSKTSMGIAQMIATNLWCGYGIEDGGLGYGADFNNVTHWMPLPDPPDTLSEVKVGV